MVVQQGEERLTKREVLLKRARARRALEVRRAERDLFTFIRLHQPHYRKPDHMRQLVEAFDRAMRGPVLCIVEAPSRHGKTSILMAAAARFMRYRAGARVAYCTYASDIAYRRSREVRELAGVAGVWVGKEQRTKQRFDPSKSVAFWQTDTGAQFVAGGRHAQWIGEGFDLILYDDPVKDASEAESQVARDEAFRVLRGTLMSRLEPGGSLFVCHQRWNEDDPIGRLKAWLETDPGAPKFEIITLRVLDDIEVARDATGNERITGGKPLCPWRYDLPALIRMASLMDDYFWPNMMQDTTPRGRRVFPELARYAAPHLDHAILFISCDPGIDGKEAAELKKLKPDPAGIVVGYAYATKDADGLDAVGVDVVWAESSHYAPIELLNYLEELQTETFAGALLLLEEVSAFRILEYVGAQLNPGLSIHAVVPRGSKVLRAQPCAKTARKGLIRVPTQGAWVAPFCKEVRQFTGKPGRRDNQVDALTQLHSQAVLMLGIQTAGAAVGGETTMHRSPY